jgi:hypothetical protein
MKSGIIDIFAESLGWVLGKVSLFAMAVLLGVGIGGLALMAGTEVGGGEFRFDSGDHPMHQYLSVVTAILPQVFVIFWAGIIFVRSEQASAYHWVTIIALEAVAMTGSFARAIPGGWMAQVAAWTVAAGGIVAVAHAVKLLERRKLKRGLDHLERLQLANAIRREELKQKYGTGSASAHDLGLL